MRPSAPRSVGGRQSRWPSIAFLVAGFVATGAYAADVSPLLTTLSLALVGLGSFAALLIGPSWHRPVPRRPWTFLTAAAGLFLVGTLVRGWAVNQHGIASLAADFFTVPGYVFMIMALMGLIRARRSHERDAVLDVLIIGGAASVATILLLSSPAAISTRPVVVSILAVGYPIFDIVVLVLLVNLAFTTAVRQPSYLLLMGTVTMLLTGDLAYAIIGTQGKLEGSTYLDLPFLLGFTMIGAAALHPSMVELGMARPLKIQAWSWQRLSLLGPAVALPFVLTATLGHEGVFGRLVLAIGGALIVLLLLLRAVDAVQAYAAAQRRAEYQATHDQLTGLPNRMMLSAEVNRRLHQPGATELWILYLDLDGFKLVNDSWGHAAGDQLIAEVADRISRAVPDSAMVARVGGDEFVIVYLGGDTGAVELAGVVLETFSDPLQMHTAEVIISASVGIAGSPRDGQTTAEALMRDADTAMYQAKAEGPGKWTVFDASMHERVRERMELELALRHALTQRELRLVYQPIVDLRTGLVLGAEALSRWDHPLRGAIPPTTFVPIAEDAGLMTKFGRWVLEESLIQLAAWREDGVVSDQFWLSINVSPRQLRDTGLPDVVREAMVRHRIPASAVVLEITESVMVDSSLHTEQVLYQLRALGVRIVVDDFGTGYSALGYLRRHPVTGVKIDRSFVNGLGSSPEDEEIVRAVVALSQAMHLTVVAEGVETTAQQNVLASLGVVLAQGLLWGTGEPPDEFSRRWSVAGTGEVGGAAGHPAETTPGGA